MPQRTEPLNKDELKEILAAIWEHSLGDQPEAVGLPLDEWSLLLKDEGLALPSSDQIATFLELSGSDLHSQAEQAKIIYEASINANKTDIELLSDLGQHAPDILKTLRSLAEATYNEKVSLLSTAGGSNAKSYLKSHPGVDVAIGVGGAAIVGTTAYAITRLVKSRLAEAAEAKANTIAIKAETDPERVLENGQKQADYLKTIKDKRMDRDLRTDAEKRIRDGNRTGTKFDDNITDTMLRDEAGARFADSSWGRGGRFQSAVKDQMQEKYYQDVKAEFEAKGLSEEQEALRAEAQSVRENFEQGLREKAGTEAREVGHDEEVAVKKDLIQSAEETENNVETKFETLEEKEAVSIETESDRVVEAWETALEDSLEDSM